MAEKGNIYFSSFFPPGNCRHYNKYFSTQLEKQPILAREKMKENKKITRTLWDFVRVTLSISFLLPEPVHAGSYKKPK